MLTSLAASVRAFTASLTFPEGPMGLDINPPQFADIKNLPLGSRNVPFSLPDVIARFS